jgi:quinol monooxygenase YgiN
MNKPERAFFLTAMLAFAATLENCEYSLREPGIARFDFVRDREDKTRFALFEVYKTDDAPAAHKETAHYQKWRDTVANMMQVPRSSVKYETLAPEEARWMTLLSSDVS